LLGMSTIFSMEKTCDIYIQLVKKCVNQIKLVVQCEKNALMYL
jgi:hypothetical protein